MREQESREHEIERAFDLVVSEHDAAKLDVGDAGCGGFGLRERHLRRVGIHAQDVAARTNAARELLRHVAAAASSVEASQAAQAAEPIEERVRARRHHAREHAQALAARNAALNDVGTRLGHRV